MKTWRAPLIMAALLVSPATVSAQDQDQKELRRQFVRENREAFPMLELQRDEIPFAKIHTLVPAAKPLAQDGRFFTGYRFRTPDWLDGSVMWLMGRPQERQGVSWSIAPEDPEDNPEFRLVFITREADRFPKFRERMPECSGFIFQSFPKEILKPGKNYIVWITFPAPQVPELKVALTIQSQRGLQEYGMLPTGYPYLGPGAGFTKSPDLRRKDPKASVNEAVVIFKKDGIPAALAYLDQELQNFIDTGSFQPFYVAVWSEAQVGEGRSELEWRASVNQWLMNRCLELEAYTAAERLVPNLCNAHLAVMRDGAAHAALAIFRTGMERRNLSLDPASYADAGAAFATLREVRKREFPVMAKRHMSIIEKEGWVTATDSLPDRFCGSMGAMAALELAAGDWRTALERRLWVDHYISHKRGEIFEAESRWYENRLAIAGALQVLGLYELAEAEYDAVIQKGWQDIYLDRAIHQARRGKILTHIARGEARKSMLPELAEIYQKLHSNRFVGPADWQMAEIVQARCLVALGRHDEAGEILARLSQAGNHEARKGRIRLMLELGKPEGLEEELLNALAGVREWGRKLDEIELYSLYAGFLEQSGRLSDAVRMRRETVQLMQGFGLFAQLPPEMARLSNLLARCGDDSGARSAAKEATALSSNRERIPPRVAAAVTSILEMSPPAPAEHPASPALVDLQPVRAYVAPVAGRPVRGRLTLSNLSHQTITGTLGITGIPASFSTDEAGVLAVLGQTGGSGLLDQVRVEPGNYLLILLSSAPGSDIEGKLTVWWRAQGQQERTSLWTFDVPESGITSAVIDAGEYRQNPFYGVPIHHHYQHSDPAAPLAALRVVASAPARIEMYDGADRPVFIDVEGDGIFTSSGDSVLQDSNADGEPDIRLENGEAPVRLQVYPHGAIPPDGIVLSVEAWIGGAWLTVAEDRLLP